MIVALAAAAIAAFLYFAVLGWRVRYPGRHARLWSRPRPAKVLHHGVHAKPHKPEPASGSEPSGLAVTA